MGTKICSKCKEEKNIDEFYFKKSEKRFNSWCKKCVYQSQNDRRKVLKKRAIDLLGGKCQICGYNRNLASIDFHHKDPSQKEYVWEKLRRKTWEDIVTELKKCMVVCKNCHSEIHNPEYNLFEVNNTLLNDLKVIMPTGKCPICKRDVYGTKYCSIKCSSLSRRKTKRPSKNKLKCLLLENGFSAIGRIYNVSDNAVRKWAKVYELI